MCYYKPGCGNWKVLACLGVWDTVILCDPTYDLFVFLEMTRLEYEYYNSEIRPWASGPTCVFNLGPKGPPVHVIHGPLRRKSRSPSNNWPASTFQPPTPADQVNSLPRRAHDLSSRSVYRLSSSGISRFQNTPYLLQILYRPRASRVHSSCLDLAGPSSQPPTLPTGHNSTRQAFF